MDALWVNGREAQRQDRSQRKSADDNRRAALLQRAQRDLYGIEPVMPIGGAQIVLAAAVSGKLAAGYRETGASKPTRNRLEFERRTPETMDQQHADAVAGEEQAPVRPPRPCVRKVAQRPHPHPQAPRQPVILDPKSRLIHPLRLAQNEAIPS